MNENDNNRIAIIFIAIIFIVIGVVVFAAVVQKKSNNNIGRLENNQKNNRNITEKNKTEEKTEALNENAADEKNDEIELTAEDTNLELTEEIKKDAQHTAQICSKMYEEGFKEGKYVSSYSYLYDITKKTNVEMEDLENNSNNKSDVAIHLFKNSDVHEFINSVSDDDKLSVYTAVKTNEGILIASSDASGVITPQQYQSLVLRYSPDNNGTPINPKMGSDEYNKITEAITKATGLKDYEIKHLACNNKYAVFVIGYAPKPDFIKECVMEKQNDGTWEITYKGIETKKSAYAEVNEKYPDFDMALYPVYSIYDYVTTYGLTIEAPNIEKMFVDKGILKSSDLPTAYVCATGNFIYIEGAAGTKVLGYKNASKQMEGFVVNNTFDAINIMREKEDNPPVFIIKMNDDMVKEQ